MKRFQVGDQWVRFDNNKKGPRYLPRARQFLLPSEGGTNLNQWRRRSAPASNSPAPANSAFAGSGACTKPGDEACNSVWL